MIYRDILTNGRFLILSLIPSFMIGGMIAFVTNANYYYINELGMTVSWFWIYQSSIMGVNTLFSYLAGRSIAKKGLAFTIKSGVFLSTLGGFAFLFTSMLFQEDYNILTGIICIYTAGLGLGFAAFTAESMNLYPNNTGAASSMISLVRGIILTVCVSMAGVMYTGYIWQVGLFVTITVILIAGLNFALRFFQKDQVQQDSCYAPNFFALTFTHCNIWIFFFKHGRDDGVTG